jgi:plasmid stabilization system protein ParE
MVDRLKKAVGRLSRFPGSGTRVTEWDRPELREIVVGNYRVIYRLKEQCVEILTVIHAARHIPDDPLDI